MIDTLTLQQDRGQLYSDFYNNKIPKRMPISVTISHHILAEYDGQNPIDVQFDYARLSKPAKEICEKIYSDSCPVAPAYFLGRIPMIYQMLGSQSFIMGKRGFIQHPEVVGMLADEYEQLIEKSYDFLLETVIPRQHKNLDMNDPVGMAIAIQKGTSSLRDDSAALIPTLMELIQTYGYYLGSPRGSSAFTEAPMDFVADQLRSFSGISMDIRRNRSLIKDACEVMMPLTFHWGLPDGAPHPEGGVTIPLHMPTFMREKDFVEVWLPSYKKMIQQYAAIGVRPQMFCEDDWTRYVDLIYSEFPAGSRLMFEYGDPQQIKDKLGKRFIISGLFPSSSLRTDTPEQIVDRAKKFLDIMLPGGGYLFSFDKNPLTLGEVNMETLAALTEFIRDYAVYDNAGESFGTPLNSEGFTFDEDAVALPKSKYIADWDDYKARYPLTPDFAKERFDKYNKEVFKFYMNLLI